MIDPATLLYIVSGLGAIIVVLIIWLVRLEHKMNRLMRGKNGASLEGTIVDILHEIDEVYQKQEQATGHRAQLEKKLRSSIRGTSTVRFNPFKDSGGNQSFATALVNENGDGVIISTLYARERMSIFGKPINAFQSTYDLTAEETEALEQARAQLNQ